MQTIDGIIDDFNLAIEELLIDVLSLRFYLFFMEHNPAPFFYCRDAADAYLYRAVDFLEQQAWDIDQLWKKLECHLC